MSELRFHALCIALATLFTMAEPALAQAGNDRTLAPYLFVQSGDPKLDQMPLLGTHADVTINGVIANVTVTQTYKNAGERPIHAQYVFPASTRAAVHGMRMKIGQQIVEARIREREQAQREFEAAKRQGKTATLLEEQRPNVFTMSVGNVMPGDRIEVTLRYSELLVPEQGTYEFVFPTVVGPRYSNQSEAGAKASDRWVKSPYLPAGARSPSRFQFEATVSAPIPIASLAVPSHKMQPTWHDPKLVELSLDESERATESRDLVLRYRLTGDAIQSGLALFEGPREKFFMAVVEPPKRVLPEQIPPREFVFIVDVSGSMSGFPLETAKHLLRDLVGRLKPRDRFNLLFFAGGSALLAPRSLPANRANIERALQALDNVDGGGGTELLPALRRALGLAPAEGLSRSFVVVTDGYISAEREVFDHIRQNLGVANVYSFGIGSGVNRYLIEGLAKAGLGQPFVVTEPAQAQATARRFREYVTAPVLTNVRVAFQGFDAYQVEPTSIPDVLAERPVVVHGKWRGKPRGKIVVSGTTGSGPYQAELDPAQATPKSENRALPYLWARTRIANLSDFGEGQVTPAERREVVQLGLNYNLLTAYTSFVAVSHQVRNHSGHAEGVQQPLPLPVGVENSAVGSNMLGASEPGLVLLACLTLLMLAGLVVWPRVRRVTR